MAVNSNRWLSGLYNTAAAALAASTPQTACKLDQEAPHLFLLCKRNPAQGDRALALPPFLSFSTPTADRDSQHERSREVSSSDSQAPACILEHAVHSLTGSLLIQGRMWFLLPGDKARTLGKPGTVPASLMTHQIRWRGTKQVWIFCLPLLTCRGELPISQLLAHTL